MQGLAMQRIVAAMADREGPSRVEFDFVMVAGHFLARDENIFTFFEGQGVRTYEASKNMAPLSVTKQVLPPAFLACAHAGGGTFFMSCNENPNAYGHWLGFFQLPLFHGLHSNAAWHSCRLTPMRAPDSGMEGLL